MTFEKLRDLERGEKESKVLQKLPENLEHEIREYLEKKQSTRKYSDIDEVEAAKNAVKKFFESRETKFAALVVHYVRSGIPPENMTQEEKEVCEKMFSAMKSRREGFFSGAFGFSSEAESLEYVVVKDIPEVVGTDMKTYSFAAGHVIKEGDIPKPLNDLLLKNGFIRRA